MLYDRLHQLIRSKEIILTLLRIPTARSTMIVHSDPIFSLQTYKVKQTTGVEDFERALIKIIFSPSSKVDRGSKSILDSSLSNLCGDANQTLPRRNVNVFDRCRILLQTKRRPLPGHPHSQTCLPFGKSSG